MELGEVEKIFRSLNKHKKFSGIDDTEDKKYWFIYFVDSYTYYLAVPKIKGKLQWYFFKSGGIHLESNCGDALEETEPWFQELVLRAEKIYESAIKNTSKFS